MASRDLYTSKEAAEAIDISHAAFRWRVWKLQMKPADRIGNYPMYSEEQINQIRDYFKSEE
jgi:hypothetical protein